MILLQKPPELMVHGTKKDSKFKLKSPSPNKKNNAKV